MTTNIDAAPGPGERVRALVSSNSSPTSYGNVVQELYVTYFGRPADAGGLKNFEQDMFDAGAPTSVAGLLADYHSNSTIKSLIDSFGTSAESAARYGAITDLASAQSFVGAVFQNLFNRAPTAAGLDFWGNAIVSGNVSVGAAALSIAAGADANTSAQGKLDSAAVANKIAVAAEFTADLAPRNAVSAYSGASAAAIARALEAGISELTVLADSNTAAEAAITAILGGGGGGSSGSTSNTGAGGGSSAAGSSGATSGSSSGGASGSAGGGSGGTASGAAFGDITAKIQADAGADNIALSGGDYVVNLSGSSAFRYSGALSGTGTLTIAGGDLVLTGASVFNLPSNVETISYTYLNLTAYSYEGYAGKAFHGGVYTIVNSDKPTLTIDAGATLQIGVTATSNAAGTSFTWLPGSLSPASSGPGGYLLDNIRLDGNLIIESSPRLGVISGTGNVILEAGSFVTMEGVNTFSGVLVNITGLTLGSDHNHASVPNASAIFNNGSLLIATPVHDTLQITQTIYENHYGNDLNFNPYSGLVIMSGMDSYTDSASDNSAPLSNTDRYSLHPALSNAAMNYTYGSGNYTGRGINIEGAVVQFGDGTGTTFFLPGNIDNTYINLHNGGVLAFDYRNTGPTYDDSAIAGGGLSFHSLDAPGAGSVVFHQGDIVVTQQQYYNGTTQIDAGATVQLGDGTAGDKTAVTGGFRETSGGDGNFMQAGQTVSIADEVGRSGSSSTGATSNNLVDNGLLIVDNVHATELLNVSGSGGLSQDGAGTTTLGANVNYTGATQIHAGVLAIGAGGSIASSSGLALYNAADTALAAPMDSASAIVAKGAATFDISQAGNQSLAGLSGTANTFVELGGNALTITTAASSIFAGIIADGGIASGKGGSLIIGGNGAETLSGANTYTGGTIVESATLELADSGAAGSGAIAFAPGAKGTLKLDGGAIANGIGGFNSGDTILLGGLTAGDHVSVSYVATTGAFTVTDAHGHNETLNFLSGSYVPTASSLTSSSEGFVTLIGSSVVVAHA
ncbi:MAG TPA: DUF4214 domain-containing protein [Burkholderiaceae bacterium]